MKLFKNKVGRPSNETKQARKIFVVSVIAIVLSVITLIICLLTNSNILNGNLMAATENYKISYQLYGNNKEDVNITKYPSYSTHGGIVKFPVAPAFTVKSGKTCSFKGWILQRNSDGRYRVINKTNGKQTWFHSRLDKKISWQYNYYKPNNTLTVGSNVSLYAVFDCKQSGKQYTVTFKGNNITKSLDGISTKEVKRTCTVVNGECTVTAPKIVLDTKGTAKVAEWSSKRDSRIDYIRSGDKILVDKNTTYYVYSVINNSADFAFVNKKTKATTISPYSCTAINSNTCSISGNEIADGIKAYKDLVEPIAGWTSSKTGTKIDYTSGNLKLNGNVDYYAIRKTPKKVTLKLNGNGSDYKTSNVTLEIKRADEKDNKYKLPRFNFPGSFSLYWCDTKDCSNNKYEISEYYSCGKNTTLYASKYFKTSFFNPLKVTNTFKVNDIINVELLNIKSSKVYNKSAINKVYKKTGKNSENVKFLFELPIKMMVTDNENYEKSKFCGDGCSYFLGGGTEYGIVTINVSKVGKDENGYLHELAHAWDDAYKGKKGMYAQNTTEFNEFYKKYEKYWDVDKTEAFAASVTNYYWYYVTNQKDKAIYGINKTKTSISNKKCTSSNICKQINSDFKTIIEKLVKNYNSKK